MIEAADTAVLEPASDMPQFPRAQGFYENLQAEVYHQAHLDVLHSGDIALIDRKSMEHYHAKKTGNVDTSEEESFALRFGRAFHCAVLEPDVFSATYTVLPADAPRRCEHLRGAKTKSDATQFSLDWWDAWEAENRGKEMLTANAFDLATRMAKRLRQQPIALGRGAVVNVATLIDDADCEKELTAVWLDEEASEAAGVEVWNTCRFDFCIARTWPFDLKTCEDASHEAFMRAMYRHYYFTQGAHYTEALRVLTGKKPNPLGFLPVEKGRPHVSASYELPEAWEERGHVVRRRAVLKLARSLREQRWFGYTDRFTPLQPQGYMLTDDKGLYE